MKKKWILTDPDNKQYGRQINDTTFEFKERGKRAVIDLKEYLRFDLNKYIASYGYTLSDNSLSNWIIAECIFEQTSGLY